MSAPSFSSFPPTFSSFPDLDQPEASTSTASAEATGKRKRDPSKKRTSSHRKNKDGRDKDARKKGRRESMAYDLFEDSLTRRDTTTHTTEDPLLDLQDERPLFYSDRKGDPLNVTYGGLHVYDVPKHFLVDRRRILGLPACTVLHRSRHEVVVAIGHGGKRNMSSLTDPSSRHLLAAPPKRRLVTSSKDKYKYDEVEGVLRVSTERSRRAEDPSYRSINADDAVADSDASGYSSEGDGGESSEYDSDTSPLTHLQTKFKELDEQIKQDPLSVSTWLSLLSHTLSTIPISSKNATKARSEIAISILSRAFAAHPENVKSKQLRLKYIKAGEEIWSSAQLHAEWEKALETRDADLWMEWLDWRIRSATDGIDGAVMESALRTLAMFRSEDSQQGELSQLRVLWRIAITIRESGFVERSMALFQAQAELIFNMPSNMVDMDFDDILDALELFWESEVPRLGEPEAKGWANWEASGRPEAESSSSSVIRPAASTHTDPYIRWTLDELNEDRSRPLPTRSFDLQNESDPYATVLFSDIRPLLVELHTPCARHLFRLIWLSFLGLHCPGITSSSSSEALDDRWASYHYGSSAYLSSIFPSSGATKRINSDSAAGVLVGREKEYTSSFGPVKNWSYGAFGPLDRIATLQWGMWTQEDVQDSNVKVIREVFKQCKLSSDDADWDVLHVTFEAAVDVSGALRVSKSILAAWGDSLPRWAAHARLEQMRHKPSGARKVYQTLLSSPRPAQASHTVLWWDWAEMEWIAGDANTALSIIRRSACSEGSGGIAILRTKRVLDEVVANTPDSRWTEREAWVKLRALLELLTSTPDAALAYLDTQLRTEKNGSLRHERLTVIALMLIYTHSNVLKQPTPPALLRERTHKAIKDYPNNTIILGFFLEGERGQGVWGRVRTMLGGGTEGDSVRKNKDVARRVADVWVARWERSRWEAEQERTRSGLSAAVEDERTRGSAALWRIYLEFEIRCGELKRAKRLLSRAVGACPLVKDLYLLAFGALRSVFTKRELQDWAEVMVERGLRLRRGLDEVLDGLDEEDSEAKMEGDEEDEIEYNARELRRLRPY
ncbi:NRDE-2, necessary for RNA interference-domain-containing protein [Cristinia sonorae]|uniref:NRDE-2, necessary for RNA interference-domain-containing protein n=1 Tax=Cristinia sonorae TaxID=1940300 RepID=A0A8K0USM7_9AGAR|nr:NRDE-2, necessary for RNA interference-domain-containing protein [Cristinia sonorae]